MWIEPGKIEIPGSSFLWILQRRVRRTWREDVGLESERSHWVGRQDSLVAKEEVTQVQL